MDINEKIKKIMGGRGIGSRIQVLDEENEPIASQRIFNPNELDEEKFQGASRCDFWEAKSDWVRKTLQSDFLKDIALRLSDETE